MTHDTRFSRSSTRGKARRSAVDGGLVLNVVSMRPKRQLFPSGKRRSAHKCMYQPDPWWASSELPKSDSGHP
jgi:hypothetical protein